MTKLKCAVYVGFASIFAVVVAVLITTSSRASPSIDTVEENKEDASALNQESISEQKDDNELADCCNINPHTSNLDTSTASRQLGDDPKALEGGESRLDDSESIECSSSACYVRNSSEENAANQDVRNCGTCQKLVIKKTMCICVCTTTSSGDCTTSRQSNSMDDNIGNNSNVSGQQTIGPVIYRGDYVAKQINVNVFSQTMTFIIFLATVYLGINYFPTAATR